MFHNPQEYLKMLKIQCVEETHEILAFWYEHAFDWDLGGIMTSLERDGRLFSTVKPVWFQGRSLYGFGRAYNDVAKNPQWLEACHCLYRFLMAHCFVAGDDVGKMYFHVEKDGTPISTMPDIFSETFAAMGLAEYFRATANPQALLDLRRVYQTLMFYYENPKYLASGYKNAPDERIKCPLPWYMMLLCTTQTARQADTEKEHYYTKIASRLVDDLFTFFYNKELDLFVEGDYDGPGHTYEVIWFVMAEAMYQNRQDLAAQMAKMARWLFDFAYDRENGGLPVIKSYVGLPDRNSNWNARQWWVQNEMLVALFFAYAQTRDVDLLERFRIAHEWVCARFIDREQGEWYAYLHPDGKPVTTIKGNLTKGPFHNVRQFVAIYNMLNAMNI